MNAALLNPRFGKTIGGNLRRSDSANSARPSIRSNSSYEINIEPPVRCFTPSLILDIDDFACLSRTRRPREEFQTTNHHHHTNTITNIHRTRTRISILARYMQLYRFHLLNRLYPFVYTPPPPPAKEDNELVHPPLLVLVKEKMKLEQNLIPLLCHPRIFHPGLYRKRSRRIELLHLLCLPYLLNYRDCRLGLFPTLLRIR
jgi:hypothetical protein